MIRAVVGKYQTSIGFSFTFITKLIECISNFYMKESRVKNWVSINPCQIKNQAETAALVLDLNTQMGKAVERIDTLEQLRMHRALASGSPHFKHVFLLLPLLIHYNIPEFPAYVENAPQGIAHFYLNAYQQRFFDTISDHHEEELSEQPMFDGLYSMGSTGSITQTTLSDLDLWLCYSDSMSNAQYQLMETKLAKLKQWAKNLGVEVNFYLMNPRHFKTNHHNSHVTEEHSGSAQHFFLLDEFYRSAIRLAGKRLLWLHLPDELYKQAVNHPSLDLSQWIDFGDFSSLSTAEFFGASLWQLYKGIESPYKSAIKILLLESYAQTYPETSLISKIFKQKLLAKEKEEYHFDPYLAMLEQVTAYLESRYEYSRLYHLRQCFYLKANEGKTLYNWRESWIKGLIEQWHWQKEDIQILNNRSHWKMKQAMAQHKMLVEQLLQSYRNLINFARKFHIDPTIMTADTDMLMRRLYSVFEVLPGKVTLINTNIASNLSEKAISFIEVIEGGNVKPGWYIVNQTPASDYDSEKRFVQYNKNLTKLVAWAYFNGVITAETKLHIVSNHVDLVKLRQFITDLRLFFPIAAPQISNEELLHPNEIRSLILAINLTNDPTEHGSNNRRSFHQSDLFNLGISEQNLVGSISIIYRNMWNEIRTHHFEGENAILNALKVISNKIYRDSAPPQSVNVFCYSQLFRSELREIIADLVHRSISVQTGTVYTKVFNTLKVDGKTWQFVFNDQNVQIKPIQEQAVENDQQNVKGSSVSSHYPKEINEFASEGFLQFFFEDSDNDCFNVYVLDERNNMESYSTCQGTKDEKIKEINRFYAENALTNLDEGIFNYPQFYQLLKFDDRVEIVPYQSKQHLDFMLNHTK